MSTPQQIHPEYVEFVSPDSFVGSWPPRGLEVPVYLGSNDFVSAVTAMIRSFERQFNGSSWVVEGVHDAIAMLLGHAFSGKLILEDFPDEQSFVSYVRQVCRHRIIDRLRRERRHSQVDYEVPVETSRSAIIDLAEIAISVFHELGPREKQVVRWRYWSTDTLNGSGNSKQELASLLADPPPVSLRPHSLTAEFLLDQLANPPTKLNAAGKTLGISSSTVSRICSDYRRTIAHRITRELLSE